MNPDVKLYVTLPIAEFACSPTNTIGLVSRHLETWLARKEQALRVADGIEAGLVFVNVVLAEGAELSFGGVKRSGSGRELGRLGADEVVNKKMIRIG